MNKKAQLSVIAALLVAVILVATVIVTYSIIRSSPIEEQPPIQSAIDEINFAIKQILGFTAGYYGSVLKVTGNSSYAKMLATDYLDSGLVNIANMHPEWAASLKVCNSELYTYWYTNASYSRGMVSIAYNLTGLGISGINYTTSCELSVSIINTTDNQACLRVTKDEGEPIVNLGKQNFKFFRYEGVNSTWDLLNPGSEPLAFANGTYQISTPTGIDPNAYFIQVEDSRGMITLASSFSQYVCTFNFSSIWSFTKANSEWWDMNYSHRRLITINNTATSAIPSDYSVLVTLNTASLIAASKMRADGSDLRIVHWDGQSWVELDRDVISVNTVSTQIWFKTQASIGSSPSAANDYYMYYGNQVAVNPPANRSKVYLWFDDFSTNTTSNYSIDRYANDWHGVNVYKPYWDSVNSAVCFNTGDDFVGGWMPNTINETNVYAEMRMKVTGSYQSNSTNGILLRWQSKDNFYGAHISGGSYPSSPCLIKNGRTTYIACKSPVEYHPWNQWFTFAVAVSGSSFRLWVDGVSKVNGTDMTITNSGKIVFLVAQAIGLMDDFKIRKYIEPEPLVSLGQEETYPGSPRPSLQHCTAVVELLQNGNMRWLGQNLNTTNARPFPPIPLKAIHVRQTVENVTSEVPFQLEDWASDYKIPLGMASNESVFNSRTMLVFLVDSSVTKVTIWWNGSDAAQQTPYAYTCNYFQGDNPDARRLNNGILNLQFSNDDQFTATSSVGSSSCTSTFMRINTDSSEYHSKESYVITHGVIRDIVHQEPEWSGGVSGCPNFYGEIVLTLPAATTYYTYQLRLMFQDSRQPRNITDLCPIVLASAMNQPQTENGTTISNATGFFYNFSSPMAGAHRWSQMLSGTRGTGIMFTDAANHMLYFFDNIAGNATGGLNVNSTAGTIELVPVKLTAANFTDAKEASWYGAVANFDGTTPIYKEQDGLRIGLCVLVEHPPTITISTET